MKKSEYIGKPAIAVYADSASTGLEILAIEYGIDDYVIVRDWRPVFTQQGKKKVEEIHRYKIYYGNKHTYFNYRNRCRYFLDDFMRV
jgi:hypothetical protein